MILHNIYVDIGLGSSYVDNPIYREFYEINSKFYKIKIWNEEMLNDLIKKYPKYLSIYTNFTHKFYKIDFMRPLILHSEGGFYMDMDNYLTKKLDIEKDYCIGRYKNEINNDLIYFKDRDIYLKLADFYLQRSTTCRMPSNWTVRRLQYICGQKSFKMFCKSKEIELPLDVPYKFNYTSAWLDAFKKKRY